MTEKEKIAKDLEKKKKKELEKRLKELKNRDPFIYKNF
tara:strand:+ start:504 stop:617 length:114 start_codon:yes stop_codon:yes gene_type:complete